MNATPIAVACAADDQFAIGMAVTLYSALANLEKSTEVVLYVLDGGIHETNRQKIERVVRKIEGIDVSVNWIRQDLLPFQRISIRPDLSAAALLRLTLPDLVPQQFDRALYLDSDLAVNVNLLELWRRDVEDYALLAVRDYVVPYVSAPNSWLQDIHESLGLAADAPYFNSGVMLLNLQVWREEKIGQAVIEFLHTHSSVPGLTDQEGLNAIAAERWGQLDLRWNVTSPLLFGLEGWPDSSLKDELRDKRDWLVRNAFILHFAWHPKPWDIAQRKTNYQRWLYYLKRSGWFSPAAFRQWYAGWLARFLTGCAVRFYQYEVKRRLEIGEDKSC